MRNKAIDLSVVMPCYLEGENLHLLLPRIKDTLKKHIPNSEILIIDTMVALDDTPDICKSNNVQYYNRKNSNSYGDAIRTGISKARGKYILFMDADGSHTPEFIPQLYKHIDYNDVVIASRYVSGGFTDNNKLLVFMSKILNIIYSKSLHMKYHDISNSFKIYRSELLKQASLECDNFDIVEELLYKLHSDNPNLKTLEIPYSFKKRMFGKTKRNLPVFVMTFAVTLLKLIWGKLNFILMMKYFFVALLGLMIDYSIYLFLLKIVKLHYFSAGFISFCFGFIINYIAGRKYVFTKGSVFKQARFEFIAVLSIQLLAIGIHQFSLYAAVDLLNIPPVYGKLVALSVTFFWNFIGRHFVYHTGH